jgi:protein CpxP
MDALEPQGEETMETPDTITTTTRPARSRFRRRLWAGIGVLLAGGALSLSVAQAHGFGDGDQPGGRAGAFMAFRMQKVLDRVGATDSQKGQIKAIWEGLRPQLTAAHQQHRQLRQQMTQAMTAPTIDPAAVEKLRQQSVQVMDRTSSLITQGMLGTAQVLTPDQRKQAAAELEKHADHHR